MMVRSAGLKPVDFCTGARHRIVTGMVFSGLKLRGAGLQKIASQRRPKNAISTIPAIAIQTLSN